jgi:hypothetical protein
MLRWLRERGEEGKKVGDVKRGENGKVDEATIRQAAGIH